MEFQSRGELVAECDYRRLGRNISAVDFHIVSNCFSLLVDFDADGQLAFGRFSVHGQCDEIVRLDGDSLPESSHLNVAVLVRGSIHLALVLEECECESAGRDKSFFGSIVLSVGECAFRTFLVGSKCDEKIRIILQKIRAIVHGYLHIVKLRGSGNGDFALVRADLERLFGLEVSILFSEAHTKCIAVISKHIVGTCVQFDGFVLGIRICVPIQTFILRTFLLEHLNGKIIDLRNVIRGKF